MELFLFILTDISSLGTAIGETNYSMVTSSVDIDPTTAPIYPAFQPSQNTGPTDVTKGTLLTIIIIMSSKGDNPTKTKFINI